MPVDIKVISALEGQLVSSRFAKDNPQAYNAIKGLIHRLRDTAEQSNAHGEILASGAAGGGGGVVTLPPYYDFVEGTYPNPLPDVARVFALDVNGYTQIEYKDSVGRGARLAADNILIAKINEPAGMTRGQAAYIIGASGANVLIRPARSDNINTMPAIGIVLDNGANNAFTRVLISGTLQQVNTAAFSEGVSLFVSSTVAGGFTIILPVAPAYAQRVGFVTRSHATQGEILVMTTGVLAEPRLHAATHYNGDTDPIDIKLLAGYPGGITTFLRGDGTFAAPPGGGGGTTPLPHATTHQIGGSDIVDVKLLGGFPADATKFLDGTGAFTIPPTNTGPQGPQGIPGPQGEIGDTGDTGPIGPIGPSGPAGTNGSQGIQGIQGPSGPPGLDGEKGDTGDLGPQGPVGPQGSQGIQGIQGPIGNTGPAGTNGVQGIAGIPGQDGSDGDIGPQGPQGIQGIQGIPGNTGNTGPAGNTGPQGIAGIPGQDGNDGDTGPVGPPGPVGATGPQGIQGLIGPKGDIGPQGEQGEQGDIGPVGPQGPAGVGGAHHATHELGGADRIQNIAVDDGTLTNPKMAFNSQPDLGFYRPNADAIGIISGGTSTNFGLQNPTLGGKDLTLRIDSLGSRIVARNGATMSIGAEVTGANPGFIIQNNGVNQWIVAGNGSITAAVDGTQDIGLTTGARPRDIFLTGKLRAPGGLDTTPLDASKISTGVVPAAAIPANVALKDASNTFTQRQIISGTNPYPVLTLLDTTQAANAQRFRIVNAAGLFFIQAVNDAETVATGNVNIDRSGNITTNGALTAAGLGTTPLDASRIAGYPADATKFLRGDNTWNAPTPSVVLLGHANGIDQNPATGTNFYYGTFAGLNIFDTVQIEIELHFTGGAPIYLYHVQSSAQIIVDLHTFGNPTTGVSIMRLHLRRHGGVAYLMHCLAMGGGTTPAMQTSLPTIDDWANTFSIVLQHSGVPSGNFVYYKISVTKIPG